MAFFLCFKAPKSTNDTVRTGGGDDVDTAFAEILKQYKQEQERDLLVVQREEFVATRAAKLHKRERKLVFVVFQRSVELEPIQKWLLEPRFRIAYNRVSYYFLAV